MPYFDEFKETKAFTLIELLVVIAIIGILSSVVLASLNGARESSRDARRGTDIQQVQTALEQLYLECGEYPTGSSTVASLDGSNISCDGSDSALADHMSQVPSDPSSGEYGYDSSNGHSYCLAASFEGGEVPDNDAGTSDTVCSNAEGAMTASNGTTYTVKN